MVDLEGDAQVRRGNKVDNRTGRGSGKGKERTQRNLNIKEKTATSGHVCPSFCVF